MRTSLITRAAFALLWMLGALSTFAQSPFGTSLRLLGSDYVRIPSMPTSVVRDSVSIEFWFNTMGGGGALLNESDGIDFSVWEHPVFWIVGGEVDVSLPNVAPVRMSGVGFRTWHHVAMTYDHRTQMLSAYLDGVLKGTSVGARSTIANRPIIYVFGHFEPNGGSYSIPGGYDEFRLWDYARTPEQIAAHWDKVMDNDEPGLVALWHFDSIERNNLLLDSTPSGTHPGLYYPRDRAPMLYPSTVPVPGVQPLLITEWAYPPPGADGGAYASFGGLLDTLGEAADIFFEWGPNLEFGNTTTVRRLGASHSEQNFYEQRLGPLATGNYNVRAVAIINGQRYEGQTLPFTIASPTVTTGESSVTNRVARLYARANGRGHAASIYFEWGSSFQYSTLAVPLTASGETSFAEEIYDAPPGVTPYRAVVRFETGIVRGQPASFTAPPPSVSYRQTTINGSSAALQLSVLSNGFDGEAFFEWGNSPALGNRTSSRSFLARPAADRPNPVWISATVTDLEPGEYFARAVLIASGVEYRSQTVSFTMATPLTPSAPSLSLSAGAVLGANAARLRVDVNPHLLPTTLRFESGVDGTFTPFRHQQVGAGQRDMIHFEDIIGLQEGAGRQFRVIASNAAGETISSVVGLAATSWAQRCFRLNGAYLETARPLTTNFASPTITLELWFNPSRFGTSLAGERSRGTNSVRRNMLEILQTGEVRARHLTYTPLILGVVSSNEWSHVALRYDAETRILTGFLNGRASVVHRPSVATQSRDFFNFGRPGSNYVFDPHNVPLEHFAGSVDEIRIWNNARSDLDLTVNRRILLAGDEPGLILNWRLDGTSFSIADESPRDNRGLLTGTFSGGLSTAPLGFGLRQLGQGNVELQFIHQPNVEARLEFTDDLTVWQPDVPLLTPSSGRVRIPRPMDASAPMRLYRIVPRY